MCDGLFYNFTIFWEFKYYSVRNENWKKLRNAKIERVSRKKGSVNRWTRKTKRKLRIDFSLIIILFKINKKNQLYSVLASKNIILGKSTIEIPGAYQVNY